MKTANIKVTGMTSDGCARVVARAIEEMGGVRSASVSWPAQEAKVQYDERFTSPDQLKLAVTSAGYGVTADSLNR